MLEELEHARSRGAEIYGEIKGYGSTADAFRITDTHPEGRGAIRCIQSALEDAGISAEQIQYINAHGTGTSVNDKVETLAIKKALGDIAHKIPVSSTKSMMGHLIAAAGATEVIVCLMAMRDGVLPPTINYENPDPECDLDYIPNEARQAKCDYALSNSFGFGGQIYFTHPRTTLLSGSSMGNPADDFRDRLFVVDRVENHVVHAVV